MSYFQCVITIESISVYTPGLTLGLNISTWDKTMLAGTWNKISNQNNSFYFNGFNQRSQK